MKIAVVGGGVAGLSVARLLGDRHDVRVFERGVNVGGLIRCAQLPQGLFHLCGGHVFNTKNEKVMSWFRSIFDLERDFVKATRNAVVCMEDGRFVPYPIENNAYRLGDEVFSRFKREMETLLASGVKECRNFDEFLRNRFGNTLYQLYFRPYNLKIWRRDLTDVPLEWFDGKLPMPSAEEMLAANAAKTAETKMVHSSFWYPRKGGSQFLVDTLAKGVQITTNVEISSIECLDEGKLCVDGEIFDAVFYCGDVRKLPAILGRELLGYEELANLECHGTTAVFCQVEANPYSWVYQPSARHDSHRIICTGNFSPENNAAGTATATVEFTGEVSEVQIKEQLGMMPFSPKYVAHQYTPCSYPIQGMNTRGLVKAVKDKLRGRHIFLAGRFAEWEYFNMDASIDSAMRAIVDFNAS